MVNMGLARDVNACTILWSAVSYKCLKWLAQCLRHPGTLYCLDLVGCKNTHAPSAPSLLLNKT